MYKKQNETSNPVGKKTTMKTLVQPVEKKTNKKTSIQSQTAFDYAPEKRLLSITSNHTIAYHAMLLVEENV